jgi:hypothetical protein
MSSVFPGADRERVGEDRAPPPEGISVFSQVERMVGEEYALLAIPTHERSEAQHSRLRELGEQLDRIWEKLRERAEARPQA